MPGTRVHEHALERINADAGNRRHLVLVDVSDHPAKDLRRRLAVVGIGVERASLPTHHGRRSHTSSADIADAQDDRSRPGGERRRTSRRRRRHRCRLRHIRPLEPGPERWAAQPAVGSAEAGRQPRARVRRRAPVRAQSGLRGEGAEQLPFARLEPAAFGEQPDPSGRRAVRVPNRHPVQRPNPPPNAR